MIIQLPLPPPGGLQLHEGTAADGQVPSGNGGGDGNGWGEPQNSARYFKKDSSRENA